ncbi:MAG: DUF6880 family protein [Saprospiraceae bacterium]
MPKLSSLPKATLVATLKTLAETNDEVRQVVARLTEDPAARVKAIKQQISAFRRRKKFVPYHEQRPVYRELEQLATSIKEDISDPVEGVKVALLAYAIDERVAYILDGSDGAIGMWFDLYLKPAFVHHAKQYPDRQKLLKLLIPFVNASGYGLRENIWNDAQDFLSLEEIHLLLKSEDGGSKALPLVNDVYKKGLAKATGDPACFLQHVSNEGELHVTDALELAKLYLKENQPSDAITYLDPLLISQGPFAIQARELAYDAYTQTKQTEEANKIIDVWLQQARTVDSLEALIKKVGSSHREDLQKRFRIRLEKDAHPSGLNVLAFLDLGEEDLAIQTFHRIDLSNSHSSSLRELVKRLPTPEHALEVSLCLRRLVEESLGYGKSKFYPTAAKRFNTTVQLAAEIGSFAQYVTHEDWVEDLRKAHGRKLGFWGLVG